MTLPINVNDLESRVDNITEMNEMILIFNQLSLSIGIFVERTRSVNNV